MNADGVESASDPAGPPGAHDDEPVPPRSHRRGMLAGLGVVGLLLAGLLFFGPGGARPRPAAQGQAGRSPVTIPLRSETTTPAPSTTTTSAPPAPIAETGPVTDLAASTYQVRAHVDVGSDAVAGPDGATPDGTRLDDNHDHGRGGATADDHHDVTARHHDDVVPAHSVRLSASRAGATPRQTSPPPPAPQLWLPSPVAE